jgi:hypothetical protein
MDTPIDDESVEEIKHDISDENSDIIKIKTKTIHIKPKSTPIFTRTKNEYPFKIKTYPLREVIREPKEEILVEVKPFIANEKEDKKQEDKEDKEEEESDSEKEVKKKSKKKKKKVETPATTPKKKKKKIPNYDAMPPADQTRYRNRFRSQFFLLRDTWGNTIPEFDDSMSLGELHELYEMYIKNIHIKNSTGKYKVYIVLMCLLIEWVCIKMGLDIGGYTMAQFKSMNKYERYLIELGEKNYNATYYNDEKWPVEMNILYIALSQALLFIFIKKLAEYIGEEFASKVINALSTVLADDVQPGKTLFDGDDPSSLIANMGSVFLKSQQPKVAVQEPAKTPKFKPVYDD